ncbi:hypothetical protein TIFTF001_029639 [Ficus carica]|uniref:Uncharacterized protein n=1 Tax=Ficus carica TaxID=3494 RepID=A0AA88J334_FICCA|nr:hypothetical protein TIFTF001_029639 [Ficus carica]
MVFSPHCRCRRRVVAQPSTPSFAATAARPWGSASVLESPSSSPENAAISDVGRLSFWQGLDFVDCSDTGLHSRTWRLTTRSLSPKRKK